MLDHVLVPLDGSALAEKALDHARKITAPGGLITLLTAVDVPEYTMTTFYATGALSGMQDDFGTVEQLVPQANDYLRNIAQSLEDGGWRVNVRADIGDAASSIVESAAQLGVDAVVMSTHGRSGINRWLFGSVTQKVLEAATCPVFVVPNERHG